MDIQAWFWSVINDSKVMTEQAIYEMLLRDFIKVGIYAHRLGKGEH